MFFHRSAPKPLPFERRFDALREAGYTLSGTRVARAGWAASVCDGRITSVGRLLDDDVAVLTDCGYQKFFVTPSGRRLPALAEELRALHAFRTDLATALGIKCLYNESLGSTSERHAYDRVTGRA